MEDNLKIVVVGLGYVGILLAVSLARTFDTTGYDINQNRIHELKYVRERTTSDRGRAFKPGSSRQR